MRVLLAIASNRARHELTQALAAKGHEVCTSAARGEGLLAAIAPARTVHGVLATQAVLGGEWLRVLRQLRRRAPDIPIVVLLRPGAELAWRLAILAGAFEALAASAANAAVLDALCHAPRSAAAKAPAPPAAHRHGHPPAGRPQASLPDGLLENRQASGCRSLDAIAGLGLPARAASRDRPGAGPEESR